MPRDPYEDKQIKDTLLMFLEDLGFYHPALKDYFNPYGTTSMWATLKLIYSGPTLLDLTYSNNPFLAMIPQQATSSQASSYYPVPIEWKQKKGNKKKKGNK